MANTNHVTLSGNLTANPILYTAETGTARCSLRLAVSGRAKTPDGWEHRSSYFDITAFGPLAEQAAGQLTKGEKIAVEGRLRWRQWTAKDGSTRQHVEIVATTIQTLTRQADQADQKTAA